MGKPAEAASAEANVENGLHILTEGSFAKTVSSGDTFIKFYAPWCGHCQKLVPTWGELAKKFEKDETVKIAKLDCTQAQSVCQENEVKGYPTLSYFRNGRKVENYKGARNMDDLNNDNFVSQVSGSPHFVMFFAPWCGHCKRLAPVWEELAAQMNKDVELEVTIAKVDCTEATALCSAQDVTGYPTLKFFKNGAEKDDGVKYKVPEQKEPETRVVRLDKDNFEEKTK